MILNENNWAIAENEWISQWKLLIVPTKGQDAGLNEMA